MSIGLSAELNCSVGYVNNRLQPEDGYQVENQRHCGHILPDTDERRYIGNRNNLVKLWIRCLY